MKFLPTCLCLFACGTHLSPALDIPPATRKSPAPATESAEETGRHAAAQTAAAIEALGPNPASRLIASIVFKAVRSSPASVLPIVQAAVSVSPQAAATAIVGAATAAVPNPWKQVAFRRIAANIGVSRKKSGPDFKAGRDGKQSSDGKGSVDLGGHAPGSRNSAGRENEGKDEITISLAEAIAGTALDTQPGLSLPELQAAVDAALLADPDKLLRDILSPRTLSGVGDAGTSNFANEPLRVRIAGNTPVTTPKPPVVSQ